MDTWPPRFSKLAGTGAQTNGNNPRVPDPVSQEFAIEFNHYFVEMTRIITERFYGDLHLFLVLVAIANASLEKIMNSPAARAKYISLKNEIVEEYDFVRLLTLAQIVGLPRNTVRRKMEKLVALGFIEYHPGRGCRPIKRVMANSATINDILGFEYFLLQRLVANFQKSGVLAADKGSKAH